MANDHDPGPEQAGERGEAHAEAAREPLKLAEATVRIGTASWTDPTMVAPGVFYPPDATNAEDRLRYYADQFPIVEVDSTYYFPPTLKNAALWAERTPTHFTFHVKAYSLLTEHPTRPASLFEDLQEAVPAEHR